MMKKLWLLSPITVLLLSLVFARHGAAQQTATLRGVVVDPSGAMVPSAAITLTSEKQTLHTKSGKDGSYTFSQLEPGSYTVAVTAKGFAALTIADLVLGVGSAKELKLALSLPVEKQEVRVNDESQSVGLSPDQNSNALVIKGSDLDALSDDPDELQNELQALAGPAAGPNGGQIFIDGFEGGQIPPKSSILEIRVNQNPFSAEFDRIGYGRVEIITKPGSQKFNGMAAGFESTSGLNTGNPIVAQQPSYDFFAGFGNVTGPLGKKAAYFFNAFGMSRQTQTIIDALNPANTSSNFIEAYPNPSSVLSLNPRVDFQLGSMNTITVRDSFFRSAATGSGVGTLNLPPQALSSNDKENTLQVGDTMLINTKLVNETHFQWRRVRGVQNSVNATPAVTVQGAFTEGGNSTGTVEDHQDNFELQNYSTATAGSHVLRFGTRLRTYRDANYSTGGANGTYTFGSLAAFEATTPTPSLYSQTVINNPLARVILFDGALFLQDDWKTSRGLVVSLGLRWEGQNRIHDHSDWAPRVAFAWSPGYTGKGPAKTVIRAGYGWFYNRFTVPNSFGSAASPYLVEAIHDNGFNQKSYVVKNPGFYNPNEAQTESQLEAAGSTVPTYHSIDPHFHAALDMQGGIGVDRQILKGLTGNVTYLYTQGVHQYLTDNVTAPDFDPATYTVTGSAPAAYDYEFQSGGFYRQQQLIMTANAHFKHASFTSNYTLNSARSDTQGATSVPTVERDPGFDYGRASFGIRNRFFLLLTYTGPWGIIFAPLLTAQSGTPYNFTIGNDLTGNNQFNARPTFGDCGAPDVVSTRYGCFDTNPAGKDETIVPYNLGTGPANVVFHMRASKTIGVGPHIKEEGDAGGQNGNNSVSGRGLSGNGGNVKLDEKLPRRFNVTFVAIALNCLNIANFGPPNGVMESPLFNKTQTLASGPYSGPTPGNRTILFFTQFSF
ncbi:Cna B domain protein [Candidatus Sulfotelmatomonas gaucii]|uniref:Cna B domain protein n=1 Tax=Candidatus Sulfuritelmatomonas gaucii TaxID=2043161 RepID=A0A2N9M5B9_9BACT|nr:Cna B domain protein [Candidatus Sulfotelmatomonas gaucii]